MRCSPVITSYDCHCYVTVQQKSQIQLQNPQTLQNLTGADTEEFICKQFVKKGKQIFVSILTEVCKKSSLLNYQILQQNSSGRSAQLLLNVMQYLLKRKAGDIVRFVFSWYSLSGPLRHLNQLTCILRIKEHVTHGKQSKISECQKQSWASSLS